MDTGVRSSPIPSKRKKKSKKDGEKRHKRSKTSESSKLEEGTVRLTMGEQVESYEPFLVSFGNGRIDGNGCEKLSFRIFRPPVGNPDWRVVTADSGRLRYTGRNYKTPGSKISKLNKYLIGVHDQEKGEMKLHSVQPFFLDTVQEENISVDLQTVAADPATFTKSKKITFEQRKELLTEFGSAKAKRTVLSRERNRLEASTVVGSVDSALLHAQAHKTNVVVTIPDVTSEKVQEKGTPSVIVPPHDDVTDEVEKIYNVYDIISEKSVQLIAQTETVQSVLLNCSREDIKTWTTNQDFPALVLRGLRVKSYLGSSETRCALLLLYCYLSSLQSMPQGDLRKSDPFGDIDIPAAVADEILTKFAQKEIGRVGFVMSRTQNEVLLGHILVLALILSQYSLELSDLSADLRIKSTRLEKLCIAVGCDIAKKKDGGSPSADLHAPIKFPVKSNFLRSKKQH